MYNDIIRFIDNFKASNPAELESKYTQGDCWVFAEALSNKFNGEIWYLPTWNHFISKIGNDYYDITGCLKLTVNDPVYSWTEYQMIEPIDSSRIKYYCIDNKENLIF